MKYSGFAVNLSKLGNIGSGLNTFSKSFLKSLDQLSLKYDVVVTENYSLSLDNKFTVPSWISSTKKISLIRPLLWLAYSYFMFPCRNKNLITTTHHIVPRVKHQVITIHDLRPYFYPESILQKIYFKFILPYKIRSVDGIFTVSNTTKNDLIKFYKADSKKIFVLPNCIDANFFCPAEKFETSGSEPYLLVVGGTMKFKNIHEILNFSDSWIFKYRLKIVSSPNAYQDFLSNICKDKNILKSVDFINNVTNNELLKLYRNASALVYPSLMEGFGIPPLEAMACGVPAIVSKIPVFQEVYGQSCIFVELGNRDSWNNAISKLNNNELLLKIKADGFKTANYYNQALMTASLRNALESIWPNVVRFK